MNVVNIVPSLDDLGIYYIPLPTDAACCPDTNIEDIVWSNKIGKIPENTAYAQSFLV